MTRGEERQQAAEDYCNNLIREATFGQFVAHKAGSKWADETMIDKACEWMDCYIDNYLFIDAENNAGIKWDDFINDFRKAMKGE